jgi:hypothetical protein
VERRRNGRVHLIERFAQGRRASAVALVALFATVGIATATIPNEGVINACYTKSGGGVRIIDATVTKCSKSETSIAWNVQGIKGDQGDPGEQGPEGPAGPSGISEAYAAVRNDPLKIELNTTAGQVVVSETAPEGNYILTVRLKLSADGIFASPVCSMPGDQVVVSLGQNETKYVTMHAAIDHNGGPIEVICTKGSPADHPDFYADDVRLTAIRVDALN